MAEVKPFVWGTSGVELLQSGDTLAGVSAGGESETVLITEATASNTVSIEFTGLDNSLYYKHIVEYYGLNSVEYSTYMLCQFQVGGAWLTSNYYGRYFNGAQSADDDNARITNIYSFSAGSYMARGTASIINLSDVSGFKSVVGDSHYGLIMPIYRKICTNSNTGAVTGLRFLMEAGNIATGVFKLYGVKA